MKSRMKPLFLSLCLFYCASPTSGIACVRVSEAEAAHARLRAVEHAKAAAILLKDAAEVVFVGRLSRLTYHQETVDSQAGPPYVLQKHQAVFDHVDGIKGKYRAGEILEFTVDKSRVVVGCSYRPKSLPRENGAGKIYLVYAGDGKILRANPVSSDYQPLNGSEEAALLREVQ